MKEEPGIALEYLRPYPLPVTKEKNQIDDDDTQVYFEGGRIMLR